ncbi:MAG: acetyl-CoA carboxylase biotin carboxylase subunit [Saprospiraceae bacterium]|nr:acetyl-CoA carboxylase biotin carboxylase subunit [Saprospiraceae bacterium]
MLKIRKILIANRGEIAIRIMRTSRKLGIKTVAVYSEVDRKAPHVSYADEAYCIGPASSSESYLRKDKIIKVALDSHCDAIHPGYGFLSENSEFAKLVIDSGLVFIGPPASAMNKMGSKIEAKKTATEIGVPLVPGTHNAISSIEEAKIIAQRTSYPLLIKASAGGGGKGMRLVNKEEELEEQMKMASSEALSAFGDGSVFIEKYVANPKHIEIQIFCDQHNNGVYLFERECSVQRRHQKLVEEAPSSCLTEKVRQKMGQDAVNLALACGYVGAGTVEFLVDDDLNYYFLEMNTRLQVEHPVTEMITGLDLVELQIRIAEGTKIPFSQSDLTITGHAIEVRICAEDSFTNFLPSIGTITKYQTPTADHIRIDDSYKEGMEIPVQYDPMIAKLIVHGTNRLDAIQKMKSAIYNFNIKGVETTLPFCSYVLENDNFLSGNYNTNFINKFYDEFLNETKYEDEIEAGAKIALYAYLNEIQKTKPIKASDNSWYLNRKKTSY